MAVEPESLPAPAFIGDEISALAYRLAGAQVRTPPSHEVETALRWAQRHSSLVLLSSEYAQHIPAPELERLLSNVSPPVVLVPDLLGRVSLENLAERLRRQLGVLE